MYKYNKIYLVSLTIFGFLFMNYCYSAEVVKTHPLVRNGVSLFLQQHFDDSLEPISQVLLAHGLTYSSHEFDVDFKDYSLVKALVNAGFSVWLLDIAGYGRSEEVSDGFRIDSDYAANDVVSAIKYIRQISGSPKIDLLGWSWGTVTASRAAILETDWVSSLILYAPLFHAFSRNKPTDSKHKNTWAHAASDFQADSEGNILPHLLEKEVMNTYLANCWKYDGDSSPNGGRMDLAAGLSKILIQAPQLTMPVLVLAGTKDPSVNIKSAKHHFALLPANEKNRFVIIEGGSHVLMLEKPFYQQFQREVISFLIRTKISHD